MREIATHIQRKQYNVLKRKKMEKWGRIFLKKASTEEKIKSDESSL